VGSSATDQVGGDGIVALPNGNYVVRSGAWSDGRGAASWGNGATGSRGVVSAANSLVGSAPGDSVGLDLVVSLSTGDYLVSSPLADHGALVDAGAVSLANGRTGRSGTLEEGPTLFGGAAGEGLLARQITLDTDHAIVRSGAGFTGPRRVEVLVNPSAGVAAQTPYALLAGQSYSVGAADLAALLGSPANVVLQASNDIRVTGDVNVTGAAGSLTLQAGRSISIESNITTSGDLTLIANDDGPGVMASDRESGPGTIRMHREAVIDAGAATVRVDLRGGGNGDLRTVGDIALSTVRAGELIISSARKVLASSTPPPEPASALAPQTPPEGPAAPRATRLPLTIVEPAPNPALELSQLGARP
jgi:hypothetical protein